MKKWQLIKSEPILTTPWISVIKNQYEINQGIVIDDYYIVKRNDFVLVVARKKEKLILVRQYRPATDQYYLALPAGYLKPNEDVLSCAKRELLEETGYEARNCRLIGELHPLPGYVYSRAFVMLCEVTTPSSSELDLLEISDVVEVDFLKVIKMIVEGEINEMQAVSAILLTKEIFLS